jgi:hypothetical protein
VTGAPSLNNRPEDALTRLEHRVGKTYKSHLAMAKRLQRRDRHWNFTLVTLSVVTTLCGVAMVNDASIYGERGSALWALIGVCTLAASLVIANASYNSRSHEAFRAYRVLQKQWADIEQHNQHVKSDRKRRYLADRHNNIYQEVLDSIPNHSSADSYSTIYVTRNVLQKLPPVGKKYVEHVTFWGNVQIKFEQALSVAGTATPLVIALLSLAALIPVAIWLLNG